jgi:predicted protein tyrosine phosphatase
MARIIVCPLTQLEARLALHGPERLISLLDPATMIETPDGFPPEGHLRLGINDIAERQDGLITPGQAHAEAIVDFVDAWDRAAPLLIHCWAGVSRSTATAFIALCRVNPDHDESAIARMVRAASPTASPNPALVAAADGVLQRQGRMIAAVAGIGRGEMCWEGVAFDLPARLGGP